jgi:hypothetical protein
VCQNGSRSNRAGIRVCIDAPDSHIATRARPGRSRTLAALALAACLVAGCGGGSTQSASSLAKRSEAVQSVAAEGALLAEDAAAGRSTGIFVREHSSELARAAATTRSSLAAARTAPALDPELRRLRRTATTVAALLDRLAGASKPEARVIGRRLEAAAGQSERLGEELG